MKKYLVTIMVFSMIVLGQIVCATPEVEPIQALDILADNNLNIFEYTFFDSPAEGKLELYDLQNIWGATGKLKVYSTTESIAASKNTSLK